MNSVEYEVRDRIAYVTLNRPEVKNALNGPAWDGLAECLRKITNSSEVLVGVFGGAGDAFCSGADLSDFGGGGPTPLERMEQLGQIALALHRLSKPTIAYVRGVAAGAGCNLALGCDLVVGTPRARFSEIFVRRGLSIDFGGSYLLPRLIGLSKAKQLAFLGDVIGIDEAVALGLVTMVVDHDDGDDQVHELARQLAERAPIALGLTKSLLNDAYLGSFSDALSREAYAQVINLGTADAAEALSAFRERRQPKFEGR